MSVLLPPSFLICQQRADPLPLCCSSESVHETTTFRDPSDHHAFEQSLSGIWQSIVDSSQDVLRISGVNPADVKGVGFDATCSLAVVDGEGNPVEVTKGETLGQVLPGLKVGEDRSCILRDGEFRFSRSLALSLPPSSS